MARAAFEEPEFEPNSPLSWTRGEYVGGGSHGKVYKCHLEDNHILAVKIVPMEPQTQKEVEALNNEIRILRKLRHKRIVSYYGSEQKDGELHLFMEFMTGGSLYDQIKSYGVLPEDLSKRYTKQMLEGVYFLHSQDIIHRDIKGLNVLLDSEGNVKLADFGLSKIIEKVGSKTNLGTSCGSPHWMAPEILWGKGYGRKADIWSLGCTVVEMLTGKPPLGHLAPHAAIFIIGSKHLNLTLSERVSNEAKTFIEAALTWEPDKRPWSHELQSYAFISNRNEMEGRALDLGQESLESAFGRPLWLPFNVEASAGKVGSEFTFSVRPITAKTAPSAETWSGKKAAKTDLPVEPGKRVLNVTLLASEWPSSEEVRPPIIKELALRLAQYIQVEVTVLVPENACSEEGRRFAEEHNIAVREAVMCPGYDSLGWLSFPPRDLAIDVVLGHGTYLSKPAQIIRESRGCKWVQVVYTVPEELISEDEVYMANLVVAVGPKLKEVYSAFLRSCLEHRDVIQLTPGIFSEFSVIKQATIDSERFTVLTFGRGDPEDFSLRGCDIAAKAIAELNDSSYRLFVGAPVGKEEDVEVSMLTCGISRHQLSVRGFAQSNKSLKKLFCEVDLLIMPSRKVGFGSLALLALSAGLPILVSGNAGFGVTLLCLQFGTEFVVESSDPKEWAKAIRAVRLKNRSVRLEEIQILRASYEATFSWEKQCETLVQKMWGIVHGVQS